MEKLEPCQLALREGKNETEHPVMKSYTVGCRYAHFEQLIHIFTLNEISTTAMTWFYLLSLLICFSSSLVPLGFKAVVHLNSEIVILSSI